jgi:ssDNA-binding Zn-finger/Zn-ribbon topoisomerase 1
MYAEGDGMDWLETLDKARGNMGPCKVCPVCDGRMVMKAGPKDTLFNVCVNESCRHRVQVEIGGNDE